MFNLPFKPAWWLRGPHLQTLWSTLFRRRRISIPWHKERVELADGDFIDLAWNTITGGPIVMILHGLEGSLYSPYATGMMEALTRQKCRAVLMHFRSCSGELNRLPRMYHSGETEDVAEVVRYLLTHEPKTPIAAVGFSIGGNVLLKWLGETGANNPLAAAVTISVPFELENSVDRLNHGFSRIYQRHLLRCLQKKIVAKCDAQRLPFSLPPIMTLRTIREFDEHVTAPLHGFHNAKNYYRIASCRQYLKQVRVPTLLLQAKDDPFMTEKAIPAPHELPDKVTLEVYEHGGHVGFISGWIPGRARYWLEDRVPLFLKNVIDIGHDDYIP